MSKLTILLTLVATLSWGADESDLRKIEQQDVGAGGASSFDAPHGEESPTYKESVKDERIEPESKALKLDPNLKAIEAEEFRVRPTLKSGTGKVILFEDPTNNEPRPGKVLLIKRAGEDVAAVRVLRNRDGKFIAKIVLKMKEIELNQEYRAIKKLGEKVREKLKAMTQPIDETIRDEELAKEIDPNDAELDRGIAKPAKKVKPVKKSDGDLERLEISEDDLADYNTDFAKSEDSEIDPYNHALSMQLGLLNNGRADGGTARYTALGLRYGYTFARKLLFDKPSTQDQLTLELGAFYYKITGYQTLSDEVTVFPFLFNGRYSVYLNEWFAVFLYGGVAKNNVTISQGTVPAGTANLSRTRPMAGLGALFKLGPGWSIRGDFGMDMLALGAMLKF